MLLMMVIVVPYLTSNIDSYNHCNDSSQDLMNIYETLINFIASKPFLLKKYSCCQKIIAQCVKNNASNNNMWY